MGTQKSKRESGQGLVEYALIMVLVSLVGIGSMSALGVSVRDVYQTVVDAFNGNADSPSGLRNFYENTFDGDLSGWATTKWGGYFGGRWRAQDGKLVGDRFAATFLEDFSQDDYTLTAAGTQFFNDKKRWQGGLLYFRTDPDTRDGYVFEIEQRNKGRQPEIYFRKWTNGYQINPPLASAPLPAGFDWDDPTDIQVQVEGDTFTAFMDGTQVLETSDATYASGTVGVASNWGSRMAVDDISIDENP
ncbi:MAG: Flp family type IVb pilin [Anaerolineaceae bacterium]|nr:Flp family type IVb pilin [Anaerolineaceae bacterium]